jgi:hypothetical protein
MMILMSLSGAGFITGSFTCSVESTGITISFFMLFLRDSYMVVYSNVDLSYRLYLLSTLFSRFFISMDANDYDDCNEDYNEDYR